MCNRQAFHHHARPHHGHRRRHRDHKFQQWAKGKGFGPGRFYPPVNVQENDDHYLMFLYAPDLEKSDFTISLTDRELTISAPSKDAEPQKWRRQEYTAGGFERKFELNEKIDTEGIEAVYEEGILKLTLPKLEGFTTSRSEIEVA